MLATGMSYPDLMALPDGYVPVLIQKLRERHQAEGRVARRRARRR